MNIINISPAQKLSSQQDNASKNNIIDIVDKRELAEISGGEWTIGVEGSISNREKRVVVNVGVRI